MEIDAQELIRERFKSRRVAISLNQMDIAGFLGVDQSTVSKCEKGERQFTMGMLERSCALFGCKLSYFFDETAHEQPFRSSFRTSSRKPEDLNAIATIQKIALNLLEMQELASR